LARSESITDLAAEHGVSRKYVYEQKGKASAALDEAFAMDASDADEVVLFELKVTRRWLRQVIVALTLMICRSSFRGVIEGVVQPRVTRKSRKTGAMPDTCAPFFS